MKKIILIATLVFTGLFADAFNLKCGDEKKWEMLNQFWKESSALNSSEKETMKIKKLHYQEAGQEVYYCWYNLSYTNNKGEKENFDRSFKVVKNDGDNGTTISFLTKKYRLTY